MSARLRAIEEAAYARAVEVCREAGKASVQIIMASTRSTYNGALAHLQKMRDEGVIGEPDAAGEHALLP